MILKDLGEAAAARPLAERADVIRKARSDRLKAGS